jgi:hypothetical protein
MNPRTESIIVGLPGLSRKNKAALIRIRLNLGVHSSGTKGIDNMPEKAVDWGKCSTG